MMTPASGCAVSSCSPRGFLEVEKRMVLDLFRKDTQLVRCLTAVAGDEIERNVSHIMVVMELGYPFNLSSGMNYGHRRRTRLRFSKST